MNSVIATGGGVRKLSHLLKNDLSNAPFWVALC